MPLAHFSRIGGYGNRTPYLLHGRPEYVPLHHQPLWEGWNIICIYFDWLMIIMKNKCCYTFFSINDKLPLQGSLKSLQSRSVVQFFCTQILSMSTTFYERLWPSWVILSLKFQQETSWWRTRCPRFFVCEGWDSVLDLLWSSTSRKTRSCW